MPGGSLTVTRKLRVVGSEPSLTVTVIVVWAPELPGNGTIVRFQAGPHPFADKWLESFDTIAAFDELAVTVRLLGVSASDGEKQITMPPCETDWSESAIRLGAVLAQLVAPGVDNPDQTLVGVVTPHVYKL